MPPGPRGWPIFGSLLQLSELPQSTLYDFSKIYGPIMMLKLGSVNTLVVTSPELAQEVLKTHDPVMSSRPLPIAANSMLYGGLDIGFSPYGQYWRYLRKVCTVGLLTAHRLSQYRVVREQEALSCLHFIVEELGRGNAVNLTDCLSTIAQNNISQIIMSKKYCFLRSGSTEVQPGSVREMIVDFGTTLGAFNIADFVPLLKPFDPQGLTKRAKEVHGRLDKFLDEVIQEHRQRLLTAKSEDYKEDFVDAMLKMGETSQLDQKLSMESIKATLLDMVIGGADTSSTSALWTFAELIKSPKVLRKVQEELDSVVGKERLVQEEDLPKLKYLDAVVKESLRMHTPSAMLLPHESTEDCEIQGYHIPARSRIFVNVWGIHRDPAVWERPLEFDPERFLNSTKDYRGRDFDFIPFGSGRRICPGMNLGALMVVYMVGLLVHALDLTLPDGQKAEELDMTEQYGVFVFKKIPLLVSGKPRLPNHVIYPAGQKVQS